MKHSAVATRKMAAVGEWEVPRRVAMKGKRKVKSRCSSFIYRVLTRVQPKLVLSSLAMNSLYKKLFSCWALCTTREAPSPAGRSPLL
ncbi:hypothetical protein FKM82_015407 [Ascaphus truei]